MNGIHLMHRVMEYDQADAALAIGAAAMSMEQGELVAIDVMTHISDPDTDPMDPAAFIPFGEGKVLNDSPISLGGNGEPTLGGSIEFVLSGPDIPGSAAVAVWGQPFTFPLGAPGTLYCLPSDVQIPLVAQGGGVFKGAATVPSAPAFAGLNLCFQGALVDPTLAFHLSNGLTVRTDNVGYGADKMGHRAGHPGRVLYNAMGHTVQSYAEPDYRMFIAGALRWGLGEAGD